MDLKGYFSQGWSQAMSGLHIKPELHAGGFTEDL